MKQNTPNKSKMKVKSSRTVNITVPPLTKEQEEEKQRKRDEKRRRAKRENEEARKMLLSNLDPYEVPLKWWEKAPIKYAFSYPPVRSRLELLMGSNVVRLTDRKYMMLLVSRIRQDHENQQMRRIQERKTQELLRTKRLILDRLIPVQDAPPEIRKYPLFQLYVYCDAIIEERRKRQLPKKVDISQSLYSLLYPRSETKGMQDDDEPDPFMKRISIDELTHLIPMTEEEIADMVKHTDSEEDIDHGYMLTKEEYDALRFETEAVKKMKQAKTVEEMYSKAHDIVGVLYTLADARRRQQKDKDKDKDKEEDATDEGSPEQPEGAPAI